MLLHDYLRQAEQRHPKKVALVSGEQRWTYHALEEKATALAGHLSGRGLGRGDLFKADDEGYFYFVARNDELIKSRGEKVSPIEVEEAIYLMPEVLEARVIGVPDQVFGQAIRAEIVLKEDQQLTAPQVKAHCRKHLEDFKVPHQVEFVAGLPKTQGGKIKRSTGS